MAAIGGVSSSDPLRFRPGPVAVGLAFLVHPLDDALEQGRAEIALAGVGQHAEDDRALFRLLGDLERYGKG